jgi:iron complex outermembrane receptor protein
MGSFGEHTVNFSRQTIRNAVVLAVRSACVAATLAGVAIPQIGLAQTSAAAQRNYNVSAGPLAEALTAFAAQAGVALSFDPTILGDRRSEGLRGTFTVQQGFARLLANSGFDAAGTGDGGYALKAAPRAGEQTMRTVRVAGDADPGESVVFTRDRGTALFGDSDIREIPFSINVIGEDEIVRRRSRNLGDILETDPAATRTYFANGVTAVSNWGMIRGFHNNRGFVDGMPMLDNDLSQVELLERIEILRGPAAFRYGFMAPGGVISETTKRPTNDPYAALHASYDNWGMLKGHVDVSSRLGADDKLGYRLNVVGNQGEGWAGDANSQRYVIGLSADYRVSDYTLVTLVLSQSKSRTDGISWAEPRFDVNGDQLPIGREDEFGPPWVYEESALARAMVRIDSQLTDNVDLVVAFGTNRADWKYANFWIDGDIQPNGDAVWAGRDIPGEHNYTFGNTAYLNFRFETGAMTHQLTAGYMLEKSSITWEMAGFDGGDWNVLDRPSIPRPSVPINYGYKVNGEQYGAFVSDQIDIGDDWHGVVGLRFTRVTSKTIEHITGGESPTDETNALTPMIGALYDVTDDFGVYASVGSGVEPGERAPTDASNPGVQLGARRSFQVEAGVKWAVIPGLATVDANLFYITQESQYYNGPNTEFKDQGEKRHIGGEVLIKGRFWEPLQISAGAQVMEAELVDAQDPAAEGARPPGVPEITGVIDATLDITAVPGLYLSGTVLHTGQIEHRTPNDNFDTDAWTRFDIGIGYVFASRDIDWNVGLRIRNITDEDYFVGSESQSWDAPRTFSFGIDAEF